MSAHALNVRICLYYVRFLTSFCAAKRVQSCRLQEGGKVIRDKRKNFLMYILSFLNLLGTSSASGNTDKEGKACFWNYDFAKIIYAWRKQAARSRASAKSRYVSKYKNNFPLKLWRECLLLILNTRVCFGLHCNGWKWCGLCLFSQSKLVSSVLEFLFCFDFCCYVFLFLT